MDKKDLIIEHKRLIKVLKKGSRRGLNKELRIQERELKKYLKKK